MMHDLLGEDEYGDEDDYGDEIMGSGGTKGGAKKKVQETDYDFM
jgi:hypothetical protein